MTSSSLPPILENLPCPQGTLMSRISSKSKLEKAATRMGQHLARFNVTPSGTLTVTAMILSYLIVISESDTPHSTPPHLSGYLIADIPHLVLAQEIFDALA